MLLAMFWMLLAMFWMLLAMTPTGNGFCDILYFYECIYVLNFKYILKYGNKWGGGSKKLFGKKFGEFFILDIL